MATSVGNVRVRVVALATQGSNVLVVEQSDGDQSWNCFPGGQLEYSETLENCLARELLEELSLEIEVGPLIACGTYDEGETTSLEMYFKCTVVDGDIDINEKHILNASFVPVQSIKQLTVYPLELTNDLASILADASRWGTYFGRFS